MKKVIALALAVMLVVGLTPAAFAASDFVIAVMGASGTTTASANDAAEFWFPDVVVGNALDSATGTFGVERDGTKTRYTLYSSGTVVTRKDVREDKITVTKQTSKQGAKVIKGVSIGYYNDATRKGLFGLSTGTTDTDIAYVQVEFYDTLVATGSVDWGLTVIIMKDKSRAAVWKMNGAFKNSSQEIDATYDYVYSYDNPVLDVKEYIKSTKIDTGAGVIINAKLFDGKKYYAKASSAFKSEDDSVVTEYPDIDIIYYLDQIGLNSSGNTVSLEINDKSLYVYDKDLNFLGMANQTLPVTSKYYVSNSELDVEVDDIEAPDEALSDATNPDMGGDDVPANINDNPGTGR